VFAVKSASFKYAFIAKESSNMSKIVGAVSAPALTTPALDLNCNYEPKLLIFDMAPTQHGLTMDTMTVGFHYVQSINFDHINFDPYKF
jgi:hypothetical protein